MLVPTNRRSAAQDKVGVSRPPPTAGPGLTAHTFSLLGSSSNWLKNLSIGWKLAVAPIIGMLCLLLLGVVA